MEPLTAATVAEVFISCKKEAHYSRELILPQPALVRVISGEVRIAGADRHYNFYAGDTVLIPRNQLGRMSKLPHNDKPCIAISIIFRRERLQQFYSVQPVFPQIHQPNGLIELEDHPLLESLFNSLTPYFKLADALPDDLAASKIEEAIRGSTCR
jgi:hypothetical protein